MKIDNPFNLLLEAAQDDIVQNTEGNLLESDIIKRFDSIQECSKSIIIAPEAVPVYNVDESYVVEMNALAGFMKSQNIGSVTEALDAIASANALQPFSVGLLVESNLEVAAMLEKANARKDKKSKNAVLGKIKKSTDIADKLKKGGYPVLKKKTEGAASGCPIEDLIKNGGSPIRKKNECGDDPSCKTNECGKNCK